MIKIYQDQIVHPSPIGEVIDKKVIYISKKAKKRFCFRVNNRAFSSIIVIIIIWFLLVLVAWVFNLILRELNDNRWLGSYLKSYTAAEWAQELALLMIKQNGYWYYEDLDHDINDKSIIISNNPLDKSKFNAWWETFISYFIDSRTDLYSASLETNSYDIIPLSYKDTSWIVHKINNNLNLSIVSWNQSELSWNIVSSSWWISWTWTFIDSTTAKEKKLDGKSFKFIDTNVSGFLSTHDNNYLILYNSSNWDISYTLRSDFISDNFFSKPRAKIISSAQVWSYKQNIETDIDNTKYLWLLKYSIFSN